MEFQKVLIALALLFVFCGPKILSIGLSSKYENSLAIPIIMFGIGLSFLLLFSLCALAVLMLFLRKESEEEEDLINGG